MDDETAEIELLEQNLNKTRLISQRMTSILTSFDTRLVKLEKSILPLYKSTQVLNRRANNIEKALLKIDEMASSQEGVAVEEAMILRGPQPGQLGVYRDALERLNATIAFKSSDRDSLTTARLIETGAGKLAQMYTKIVAEASSGSTPAPGSEIIVRPFPLSLLASLEPVISLLRTLPLPATHPSHPASPAVLTMLKDAQRGYADMRGNWIKKCLEAQGKRVVDRAETVDAVLSGREFGKWVEGLLTMAEEEYAILLELSPLVDPAMIASAYSTLLNPLLTLFSNTLTSVISLIKRSLHKYTFLALSSFASLSFLQPRWDNLLSRRLGSVSETRREANNELKDGLHALRAVCLRSFPEFLADVKLAAMGKGGELNTGLADVTTSTITYMERIPEVRSAVGSTLVTLGDGNWKMGEGVQVGKASKLGEGDEDIILQHYMYDVVTTAISSLAALARTQRRAPYASIFLLNNIAYLRSYTILEHATPELSALLSKPAQDALNHNFRTAKAGYFDSNFSSLMQALTDDPKEKSIGRATKEKFTRFFDLLEEVMERHNLAKVLEHDPGGREVIAEEVVKLVVPSLQRFTQRHREKEFSRNPQKYIKMSAEAVETQLRGFYR